MTDREMGFAEECRKRGIGEYEAGVLFKIADAWDIGRAVASGDFMGRMGFKPNDPSDTAADDYRRWRNARDSGKLGTAWGRFWSNAVRLWNPEKISHHAEQEEMKLQDEYMQEWARRRSRERAQETGRKLIAGEPVGNRWTPNSLHRNGPGGGNGYGYGGPMPYGGYGGPSWGGYGGGYSNPGWNPPPSTFM